LTVQNQKKKNSKEEEKRGRRAGHPTFESGSVAHLKWFTPLIIKGSQV